MPLSRRFSGSEFLERDFLGWMILLEVRKALTPVRIVCAGARIAWRVRRRRTGQNRSARETDVGEAPTVSRL